MSETDISKSAVIAPPIDDVLFDVVNHVGIVTLNRPRALNALSHAMGQSIAARLSDWAVDADIYLVLLRAAPGKAFCAGGDIRALYQQFRQQQTFPIDFFIDEYRLDYAIHHYPKPFVALMDGIVMGGGAGLTQGAALRIITERTRFAMPETGIGLVPDVGATYFLTRLPIELALYLGVTGVTLAAPEMLAVTLADACVPSTACVQIESSVAAIAWHGDALATFSAALFENDATRVAAGRQHASHKALREALLESSLHPVFQHFDAHRSPRMVMTSLASAAAVDAGADSWAKTTLDLMLKRSPLAMSLTWQALLRGRDMSLADCFRAELGLMRRAFEEGDFIEGVRALLIDKDHAPHWQPATLEAVTADRIEHFCASPWPASQHPLRELGQI